MITPNHEDLIRQRAYALWEAQGKPDGHDKEHWEQAERELSERADLDISDEQSEVKQPTPPAGYATH
jgi:hypothetical protein